MKCREEKNLILLAVVRLPWIQGFQHANSTQHISKNLGMGEENSNSVYMKNKEREDGNIFSFFFESSNSFFSYTYLLILHSESKFKMRRMMKNCV